jgi:uncharacterized peroxidase-related enzyme
MPWIKEINPNENPILKRIYENATSRTKEKVANILKVHSIEPQTLDIHMMLYEHIMFGKSELSRRQREMIGVVVSKTNTCGYCVSHHATSFFHVTEDHDLMNDISNDFRNASLSQTDLAICLYVEKLTQHPYRMEEDDVISLRKNNLCDLAIFQINQICAYFNYVNRIVFGLGVELE